MSSLQPVCLLSRQWQCALGFVASVAGYTPRGTSLHCQRSTKRPLCDPVSTHSSQETSTNTTTKTQSTQREAYRLKKMYADVCDGTASRDRSHLQAVGEEMAAVLSRDSVDRETVQTAAKVLRSVCYQLQPRSDFFESLSDALLTLNNESALKEFLPSLMWSCSRTRYYSNTLLSHLEGFVLDNLREFGWKELNIIVHTYAYFNHHVPQLIPKVERLLLSSDKLSRPGEYYLPWTVAWAAMVLRDYPRELLTHILRDSYITDCIQMNFLCLFQLNISLNKDCPDLELGLGYSNSGNRERHFGQCRSGLRGISDEVFLRVYQDRIRAYTTQKSSIFGSVLLRAIKAALGSPMLVQNNALSLSGYIFDYELLFDKRDEPIRIPWEWKHRSVRLLETSIGMGKSTQNRVRISKDLVDIMREIESDPQGKGGGGTTVPVKYTKYKNVNLASDWGSRFLSLSGPLEPVRRVVVEANGHHHYASNCDHTLGATVLKRRHAEALGWQVVSIDYRLWRTLQNGDAQSQHIYSKLYNV